MKVLQVITSLETGGAETLVCNMISCLVSRGIDVDLCLFDGTETPLLGILRRNQNIKIFKLGNSCYNFLYILKLIRIMDGYDVIHSHNSSPQLFVAISNIFCGKAIVTTEHSTNNRRRGNFLLRILDRWMYRQYDKIICISQIAQESLLNYLGTAITYRGNISVINNGVDVSRFSNVKPIQRKDVGSRDDVFVVTMVAGFRDEKDQDTLIKAFSHLPKEEYELWLVGNGKRKSQIEHCIKEYGVVDNVKLLGVRMDVPSILKASDVIVMSSHWEGLSLSNIEGMSVGKPFIASDVDGLKQVTEGYGLLFPHEDDKSLATIIEKLKNNRELYNDVSKRCYNRAKQFDIGTMIDRYIDVYKSLI